MNDLTPEAVNEYFEVIHSIDDSLADIHSTLSDLADSIARIAEALEVLTHNENNE